MPEPDPNPFESPKAAGTTPERTSGIVHRVVIVVLAVLLTPVAAFVGGFCCCYSVIVVGASIDTGGAIWPVLMIVGFFAGAVLAGGAVIYWLVRLSRAWKRPGTN